MYDSYAASLSWECAEGHQWNTSFKSVNNGFWCPKCAGPGRKHSLEELQAIAARHGGRCLSSAYSGSAKMLWGCERGHQWEAMAGSILHGSWCPLCYQQAHMCAECEVRELFQSYLGKPFPSSWPEWLAADGRLQLDGYNEGLRLAFEYQGVQHYTRVAFFHHTGDALARLQERDRRKAELCRAHGVTLICVPNHILPGVLGPWVRARLEEHGFVVIPSVTTEPALAFALACTMLPLPDADSAGYIGSLDDPEPVDPEAPLEAWLGIPESRPLR